MLDNNARPISTFYERQKLANAQRISDGKFADVYPKLKEAKLIAKAYSSAKSKNVPEPQLDRVTRALSVRDENLLAELMQRKLVRAAAVDLQSLQAFRAFLCESFHRAAQYGCYYGRRAVVSLTTVELYALAFVNPPTCVPADWEPTVANAVALAEGLLDISPLIENEHVLYVQFEWETNGSVASTRRAYLTYSGVAELFKGKAASSLLEQLRQEMQLCSDADPTRSYIECPADAQDDE